MIGAHLITYPGDAGLILGYSDRTYIFARSDAPAAIDPTTLTLPQQWETAGSLRATDAQVRHADAPLMRVAKTAGLSIETNRNRVGLSLGFANRYALSISTSGSRVVLIRHVAGDYAGTQVIISEEERE